MLAVWAVCPLRESLCDFSEVDRIVSQGISSGAFPGAQVIIGTETGILHERYYGNYTYDETSRAVSEESIYDIASLTKVVATTTAIMILYDAGRIDLNEAVTKYIPEFGNNGKESVTVLNLLLHNSGLEAFVPFHTMYQSKDQVLDHIYTCSLKYQTGSKTVYSDLNAILLGLIVENVSGMSLDEYCRKNVFEPLGMTSTDFKPQGKMKDLSVPTENDNYWRMRLLKGEVHDEAAAMMEGVSGNAGLFSNAKDLYRFAKMMLNEGRYSGYQVSDNSRILNDVTVGLFTSRYNGLSYDNTRALGWETKPKMEKFRIACGESISENCFGHTGYTGTSMWSDKDRKLIVIFLTNRVFPSRQNNQIREIRPDLHNAAIRAFENSN